MGLSVLVVQPFLGPVKKRLRCKTTVPDDVVPLAPLIPLRPAPKPRAIVRSLGRTATDEFDPDEIAQVNLMTGDKRNQEKKRILHNRDAVAQNRHYIVRNNNVVGDGELHCTNCSQTGKWVNWKCLAKGWCKK